MKNKLYQLSGIVLAAILNAESFAATPAELFRQNEQLLREQQQRLKMQERERLLQELERSIFDLDVPLPEVEKKPGISKELCFEIIEIDLQGADNLLNSEKQALVKPWIGQCMNLDDIDTLRTQIDRFYIEKGWVMSRAYLLPGQNLKAGKLIYKVLEGTLDNIQLNENNSGDRAQVATAFPGMKDEIIYIRDIEQGLDQINRLASNQATMSIEPVKNKPGYSSILVRNEPYNPVRFYMGFDNQGSESTGKQRGKLSADIDNLLSVNDRIYFSTDTAAWNSDEQTDSKSYSINIDIPYGYWNYGIRTNYSEYTSVVEDPVAPFLLSGESWDHALKVGRIVHRGKNSKTSASAELRLKDTTTFIEDVVLESSSRKLTVFDLQLLHILRQPGGFWSFQATYSRGLEILDAFLDAPETGDDIPKAQFEKLGFYVSLNKQFKLWNNNWTYLGAMSGQLSRDPLFGSEQITIGDLYTVRGFRDGPASGDSGLYVKNDIIWQMAATHGLFQRLQLLAGLDIGHVAVKNNNIANTGKGDATLVGLSVGAQQTVNYTHDQQLRWSLSIGTPLSEPDYVEEDNLVAFFDLNWKFW